MWEPRTWERNNNLCAAMQKLLRCGGGIVTTHKNSEAVHPSTARRLEKLGYAKIDWQYSLVHNVRPTGHITLTDKGREVAERMFS